MAATLVTKSLKDGAGNSFTGQFLDGTTGDGTGTLYPVDAPASFVQRLLSAANSANNTNIKGSAGIVYFIEGWNAGTITYLKLYNKATAPVMGTDTPIYTCYLPASAKFQLSFPFGLNFATGIGFALGTVAADNDSTAVASAAVLALNILYS